MCLPGCLCLQRLKLACKPVCIHGLQLASLYVSLYASGACSLPAIVPT